MTEEKEMTVSRQNSQLADRGYRGERRDRRQKEMTDDRVTSLSLIVLPALLCSAPVLHTSEREK